MTLAEAKDELAKATTPEKKAQWAQVVALKEARVAAGGPECIRVHGGQAKGVPIGENPYDNAFNPWTRY